MKQSMSEIYRYKFTPNIVEKLKQFSDVHRFDEPEQFKEAWDEWVKENDEIISREETKLQEMGYKGDTIVKMYKSVRYYYKNKKYHEKKNIQRKKYVPLNKSFIKIIDEYIRLHGIKIKPSEGYEEFIKNEKFKDDLNNEQTRLKSLEVNDEEFHKKLKKTYKNRYFLCQEKHKNLILFKQ